MSISMGPKPERCPNPECGRGDGFTFQQVRFVYDSRKQLGTSRVDQIPREKIVIWKCDNCHCLIEYTYDAS